MVGGAGCAVPQPRLDLTHILWLSGCRRNRLGEVDTFPLHLSARYAGQRSLWALPLSTAARLRNKPAGLFPACPHCAVMIDEAPCRSGQQPISFKDFC